MGSIAFRTVFGGPDAEIVYQTTLITRALGDVDLPYDLDILLHIGGEISSSDEPTGLRAPRVSVAKKTITGQIIVRYDELRGAGEISEFLETTIHTALRQMIARIAAKDPEVDPHTETAKLDAVRGA